MIVDCHHILDSVFAFQNQQFLLSTIKIISSLVARQKAGIPVKFLRYSNSSILIPEYSTVMSTLKDLVTLQPWSAVRNFILSKKWGPCSLTV